MKKQYFAFAKLCCGCYNLDRMRKVTPDIEQQLRQAIVNAKDTSCYRLSQLTGVSEAVFSLFVNGKRSITMTTAAKIAKVLDLELKSRKRKGR